MGVPVKLGAGGVEEVIELDLTAEEKSAFDESANHVRELIKSLS
jgi:malate dehydrogenase